jgi:hypothetical protein
MSRCSCHEILRAGTPGQDSAELGKLEVGQTIRYCEACTNETGQTRVKFRTADGQLAWVSANAGTSANKVLERLNDDGSQMKGGADAGGDVSGDYSRVLVATQVRANGTHY